MVLKELRWRTSEFDGETTPFYATACFWELRIGISQTLFLEVSSHQGHIGRVGRELIISGTRERLFCRLFSTMEITGNRLVLSAIRIALFLGWKWMWYSGKRRWWQIVYGEMVRKARLQLEKNMNWREYIVMFEHDDETPNRLRLKYLQWLKQMDFFKKCYQIVGNVKRSFMTMVPNSNSVGKSNFWKLIMATYAPGLKLMEYAISLSTIWMLIHHSTEVYRLVIWCFFELWYSLLESFVLLISGWILLPVVAHLWQGLLLRLHLFHHWKAVPMIVLPPQPLITQCVRRLIWFLTVRNPRRSVYLLRLTVFFKEWYRAISIQAIRPAG